MQTVEHHPEAGGDVREFAPLHGSVLANVGLRAIVDMCYRLCGLHLVWPVAQRYPIQLGIHQTRLLAHEGRPGIAAPNRPHKDGELYTFIVAMGRHGVRGGETEVFDDAGSGQVGEVLFRAALQSPLDVVGIFDPLVFHNVRPVELEQGFTWGYRDAFLVDFTPMVPVLVGGADRLPFAPLPHATLKLA